MKVIFAYSRLIIVILFTLSVFLLVMPMLVMADAPQWAPYGGPKVPTEPSVHHTEVIDPIGDTYGGGDIQHDITSFSAYFTRNDLILRICFVDPISPPNSGQPNSVAGYIDIDADQNAETGIISHVDEFSPYITGLGVDYIVDFFDYSSATGDTIVINHLWEEVGRASVIFSSSCITVSVPLAILGEDNGAVNTATVIGTVPEPTDACPNGGFIESSVYGEQAAIVGGEIVGEHFTEILLPWLALAGVIAVGGILLVRRKAKA
ncbi:hypothetical protein ACFLXT_02940 [Chloroflexota bacterium]